MLQTRISRNRLSKVGTVLLFFLCTLFLLTQMLKLGSMTSISSDAADIWKTITTFYTDERYPSYVLYKGFASVYPYVWLYQLALLFSTNEFFFVMCYHALLFGYIVAFGAPALIYSLTDYEPKWWQKVILAVILYWYWDRYYVLSELMVDLPTCAFFLFAIQCAASISHYSGWRRWGLTCLAGFLCGLCANISGQYSISALCILIFSAIQLWRGTVPTKFEVKKHRRLMFLLSSFILCFCMISVKFLNIWFDATVLQPFAEAGTPILFSAQDWLERGLIYMIDKPRIFYGPWLYDARGHEIIMSLYGTEEGTRLLELAEVKQFGWPISTYFRAFLYYPVDFIMLYLNRLIISISDDMGSAALRSLMPGYTMVYLAFLTTARRMKRVRDILCAKFWLVLGVLASIIPPLVMAIEPRYTISLQTMLFGVALAGPILPELWISVSDGIRNCRQEGCLRYLLDRRVPWALIGWAVFCAVCLAYFGSICAASDLGTAMLYHW